MKRVFFFWLILVLLLQTACGAQQKSPTPEAQSQTTTAPLATEPTAELPAEPLPNQIVVTDCEFRQKVKNERFYIFKKPQHDGKIAKVLPVGTYTILQETYDENGCHWGKLKSGEGWICLTEILENREPVQIEEAKESFLNSGEYIKYGKVSGEYTIAVRVQGSETLTDIAVYQVDIDTSKATGSKIIEKDTLAKDSYMVMWLAFPGDFDTYEIHFTNETGTRYKYQIGENLSGEGERISIWLVE